MKKLLCGFFSILFVLMNSNLQVSSQTTERKKPKIKNFGASLKRTPQENLIGRKKKQSSESENADDEETIKIETNLVVFDFLILTAKGAAVGGLKKEDFIVTEDNQPQEIQTFTLGDDARVPRSIVLIIDYSGSQLPYLERSIEAAKLLVDKLRPNDLMAVVTDDVEIIANYTNDKKKLKNNLDSLKINSSSFGSFSNFGGGSTFPVRSFGRSKQFSALYSVLNEMFNAEDVRPIIIFQTDGDEFLNLKGQYGNLIYPPNPYSQPTDFSLGDLLEATNKSRALIFTVFPGVKLLGLSEEEKKIKLEKEREIRFRALGIKPDSFPKPSKEILEKSRITQELIKKYYPNGIPDVQAVLAGLSKYSGGWIDFLETPEQADEIYSKILSQIELRYIISYSPTNEAKDGKRRAVRVSIKNHPEYIVWGRKTYLAPLPE